MGTGALAIWVLDTVCTVGIGYCKKVLVLDNLVSALVTGFGLGIGYCVQCVYRII